MSAAETLRPRAPTDCDATGPAAATVPARGPCQRAALVEALLKRDAAVQEIGRAGAQLTSAELALAVEDYQRERARLAGLRTAS